MKFIVGHDGSTPARRALERTAEVAREGDEVVVVHAAAPMLEDPERGVVPPPERDEPKRLIAEAHDVLRRAGITPAAIVEEGDPGVVLADAAREVGADVVVVGRHGRGAVERVVLGSVSAAIVNDAPCDVLIVR